MDKIKKKSITHDTKRIFIVKMKIIVTKEGEVFMKKLEKEFYGEERKKYSLLTNTKNKVNGITLIALVVSIVVLLILAGVSIATLTGENR